MSKGRGELFIKTLKRIGYNEADNLEDCDFDWMFSNDDLKPLLEVFCSLDENNVLTSEEIQEFSLLSAGELAEIEVLEKSGQIEKSTSANDEKREELNFLTEHLKQIEYHNRTLERKIELFKKHEKNLLESKGESEKLFLEAKEKYHSYTESVSQAESEFSSSFESIFKKVQDLKSIILQADTDESKIPISGSFKDIVNEYLRDERKILQCVNEFLNCNFQLQEMDNMLSFACLNFEDEELQKEALFLQKTMKKNIAEKVMSDKEIKKNENFVKNIDQLQTSDFNCYSLDPRSKLEDAVKLNLKLKKDEQDLSVHLLDAISKFVDARFSEITLSAVKQAKKLLQDAREEIFLPMNTLLHQKARLEMLIGSLHQHSDELHELKKLIENAFHQIEQEYEHMKERKLQTENILKILEPKKNGDSENSIYLSIYKILTMANESENRELSGISSEEVLQKVNKFLEAKENLQRKHNEKLKIIESMEKNAASLEELLTCTNKEYRNWQELDQDLNAALNNLVMQSSSSASSFSECSKELNTHQDLLEKKANLRLARNLYIYALMNKDIFKKCINDIKEAIDLN